LQDEEINTDEKYRAVVELYKMESKTNAALVKEQFAKTLGITPTLIRQAFDFCEFAEEEPELAKTVAPHIIIETASLPKEERREVLKEARNI